MSTCFSVFTKMTEPTDPICCRIQEIRQKTTGPRGKSRFARMLGLAPSTYEYYEVDRVPPAGVLVDMARAAGVDLRWLLTGQAEPSAVPLDHPVLTRAAELLARSPASAGPLAAFLEILEGTQAFPDAHAAESAADDGDDDTTASRECRPTMPAATHSAGGIDTDKWIPILGRSAAGVLAWWQEGQEDLSNLGRAIDRHAAATATRSEARQQAPAPGPIETAVQIITLREPLGPAETAEFLAAPHLQRIAPDAFALRIDGESMSPEIRHGDLVVLSPQRPARAGHAAVVQLRGAIGVTCKLYHPDGGQVHLVPINEAVAPVSTSADEVQWALDVLAVIRP
jgi:SOS-response transcriptional repressor LexA/transcriptional regulator with XRE-family HTH domain